jgi:hypothetical protein
MQKFTKALSIVAAMAMLGSAGTANADLLARGAVSPLNGYPTWYQDFNGLALSLCLDQNPVTPGVLGPTACVLTPDFDPDPGAAALRTIPGGPFLPITTVPAQIADNTFPDEAFYFMASTSGVSLGGGIDVILYEAAIESGFAAAVVNGGQAVFSRIRVRANVTVTGTYTMTHPYGVETFVINAIDPGAPEINFTNDVPGLVPGAFDTAVTPTIGFGPPFVGPIFLTRADGTLFIHPVTGDRYIGDNATPVAVTGGLNGVNSVTITGPAGTFTSNTFVLMGKVIGIEVTPTGAQDFGVVKAGATSAAKTFTVTNFTGLSATIAPLTSSNPDYTFPVAADTCSNAVLTSVAPGNTCTFDVVLTPLVDGATTGTITISTANAPNATINVTGIGDAIAPTLTVGPNFFTNALSATISGTATDNILVHDILVSLGGVSQGGSTVTNGNWSFVVSGLALNAPNVFTVAAVDAALPAPGNTTTSTITVTHDNILPAVSVTTPVATSLINTRTPTINYTVSDTNLDLEALVVKVDGTTVPVLTGQPLPSLLDGPHTVTVDGSDLAGNHTIINNIFTVDATPPVITVASPKVFNGRVGNTSPALTFTVADANLLPLNTVVRLDGVVVPTGTATLGPFLVASSHTLTIDALDGAGNPSSFTTLPFTIVLSDGRIVAVSPADPGVADALLALKHAVGILPLLVGDQFAHGDVAPLDANGVPQPNGVIDIADALTILKRAVGLPPIF